MYLAFKEIEREKGRYGLIVLMIFLITYLIFMLSSLSSGLASENTQAIYSWDAQKIVLNKNSNINLSQSFLTKDDLQDLKMGKKEALVGLTPFVAKAKGHTALSAQFLGIEKNQFIYKDQELVSGHKAKGTYEVTADIGFKNNGYKLGDEISLNDSKKKYKIVGFVKDAKINIAPIVYGNVKTWKTLRSAMPNVAASIIVSQNPNFKFNHKNAKTYNVKTVVDKLPGYSAQNSTFELMIGFLFVISLIVIAVFLYILTMQKMHNFAVMRAQGIPNKTLIWSTISQSIILMLAGVVIALLGMAFTSAVLPPTVPMDFSWWIMASGSLGMLSMGIIGSLIPIRSILKVDPAQAI